MEDLLPKTGYRARIINAVKHDKNHPVNNGVKMQAHHLVSAKGVQLANVGRKLVALGYNINVLENLVLLPCTLQGACYLKVQLHKGDHTYNDDSHPESYHKKVQRYLKRIEDFIDDCGACGSRESQESNRDKVQKKIDKLSADLLDDIEEFAVPLTAIFRNFMPESKEGCANAVSIESAAGQLCNHERNHWRVHSQGGNEFIQYKGKIPYGLKVGK